IPVFAHDNHIGFDQLFFKSGGLPEKTFDHPGVVLCKHGWNGVPFCGELKNAEVVIVLPKSALIGMIIDIRKFILIRVANKPEVCEGKCVFIIKFLLSLWICWVAIIHAFTHINSFSSPGSVITIRSRT